MRGLAEIKMSPCQYFWLLLDYRDIWIYPNERTVACALWCQLIILSSLYYQVDKSSELPGWRLVTMNTVYLWRHFPDEKYGSIDYKRYHLIKLMKKERMMRFNRFKYIKTRQDSLYRHISVSSWVGAPFKFYCHSSHLYDCMRPVTA